jgi:hypothetical protein
MPNLRRMGICPNRSQGASNNSLNILPISSAETVPFDVVVIECL